MSTARFFVTGENTEWYQIRIHEEIVARGLEGNAIRASKNTIAVVVEGSKDVIEELYNNLSKLNSAEIKFSKITFGEYEATDKTSRDLMFTNSMDVLIRLLEKIEENTREMNRKIDEALGKKTETSSISTEASSGFSSIFGND